MNFWIEAGYEQQRCDEHDSWYYPDCGEVEEVMELAKIWGFITIFNSENAEDELFIPAAEVTDDLPF